MSFPSSSSGETAYVAMLGLALALVLGGALAGWSALDSGEYEADPISLDDLLLPGNQAGQVHPACR